jgi:hypothetical protein
LLHHVSVARSHAAGAHAALRTRALRVATAAATASALRATRLYRSTAALHSLELASTPHQPTLALLRTLTRLGRQRLVELIALPGAQIQHFLALLLAKFLDRPALFWRENIATPSGRRRRDGWRSAAPLRLPQSCHCRERRHREQPSSAVHVISKVRAE